MKGLLPPPGAVRLLSIGGLVRTTGFGIMTSISVLYFTRSVGLSAAQVGIGLTIAGGCGIAASVISGRVADAVGARNTAITLVLIQSLAVCGYAFVTSFTGFVIAVSVVLSCHSAAEAARGALVAGLIPAEGRVRARAYLHSVTNAGLSIGAVSGGVALQADTQGVYVGLILACGALFASSGLLYMLLPQVEPVAAPSGRGSWEVWRDRPFLLFAGLNAILAANDTVLVVVLPIWIAQQTEAPLAVFSVVLIFNTLMVVLFQVRASKTTSDIPGGARAMRRSGVLFAVCFALWAFASGQPAWLAVVALLAGAVVHTLGELLWGAGAWTLAYEMAPDHAQGQYQGVFTMSTQLETMVMPVAGTMLILPAGSLGWLLFALLLLVAGLAAPAVARRHTNRHTNRQGTPSWN
ncbi:MFS transporter [Kibdelosporangium aridum]|uniref:Major Facilitator Superfamily protein n=1 Tax=Kibdelosporangium aridum TaxID=2030 RepID=A0A1Y5XP62_KIBAR|nr:MFS transporter [Kibdelosporangium aridum]SMD05874.1 Major Facilitator Superfamily protein [Kibdelosporangium aridum]